jgi:hypothetical protein
MAIIADFMLVYLPAPTVSLRPALATGAGSIAKFFHNCPDNAFQVRVFFPIEKCNYLNSLPRLCELKDTLDYLFLVLKFRLPLLEHHIHFYRDLVQ